MANLTSRLDLFHDHLDFAVGFDQGNSLYDKIGLFDGLTEDTSEDLPLLHFMHEHLEFYHPADKTLHTQLYHRIGEYDALTTAPPVSADGLPYIAMRIGLGTHLT